MRDVDLAIDHRGGDDFVRIVSVMRPGGVIATLKGANPTGEALAREKGVRIERVFVQPDGEALEKIADRLATGRLQVAVSRGCPWPRRPPRTPSSRGRAEVAVSCSMSPDSTHMEGL